MPAFTKILDGLDISHMLAQLAANPQLWDQYADRKGEGSPHNAMSDIWLRYRARDELTSREAFLGPHKPVWYPAAQMLPEAKHIAMHLVEHVQARLLGGVLVTKIPPGGKILPHHDRGSWHAEYMNCKCYVPLQSNAGCVNYCDGDAQVMMPGEVWTFDNLRTHSVYNDGAEDRITLIICMRVE